MLTWGLLCFIFTSLLNSVNIIRTRQINSIYCKNRNGETVSIEPDEEDLFINDFDDNKNVIINHLLDTFQYKNKLTGEDAKVFFDDYNIYLNLQLGIINKKEFLIARIEE